MLVLFDGQRLPPAAAIGAFVSLMVGVRVDFSLFLALNESSFCRLWPPTSSVPRTSIAAQDDIILLYPMVMISRALDDVLQLPLP